MPKQNPSNGFIQQVIDHCKKLEEMNQSSYISSQIESLASHFAPPIGDSCCPFHALLAIILNATWMSRELAKDVGFDIKATRSDGEIQDQVKYILQQASNLKIKTIEAAHLMMLCSFIIMNDIANSCDLDCPPNGIVKDP